MTEQDEQDERLELNTESVTVESTETTTNVTDEYDSPWKEAIEHFFPDFMAFYFPDAYAQIDWSQGYTFLEQELRSVIHDATLGKRFVDKLAQMKLNNGEESWIYVHVEIQASRDSNFAKRMFTYNYRIYDKYSLPVGSFAVLADDYPQWQPNHFGYEVGGSRFCLDFPTAKLLHYADQMDALLASDNSFALVTAAHLKTRATRGKNNERLDAKYMLMRTLLRKGWASERIRRLLKVLDWMLYLPPEMDNKLWQNIQKSEGEKVMTYVTSIERIGIEKGVMQGIQQGIQQGVIQGMIQGVIQGESKLLRKQLMRRFGDLPDWVSDKLSNAGEQDLEQWGDAVLSAPTLDAIFGNDTTH